MANPALSKHTIVVEHVTIQSSNAFDIVRTKLEALLPRNRRRCLHALAIR